MEIQMPDLQNLFRKTQGGSSNHKGYLVTTIAQLRALNHLAVTEMVGTCALSIRPPIRYNTCQHDTWAITEEAITEKVGACVLSIRPFASIWYLD